jgi:hypothetical protein
MTTPKHERNFCGFYFKRLPVRVGTNHVLAALARGASPWSNVMGNQQQQNNPGQGGQQGGQQKPGQQTQNPGQGGQQGGQKPGQQGGQHGSQNR